MSLSFFLFALNFPSERVKHKIVDLTKMRQQNDSLVL